MIKVTDAESIDTKIREHYEQCYEDKFDNVDDMDKIFKRHKVPKLMQEEINNLNNSISIKDIEFI